MTTFTIPNTDGQYIRPYRQAGDVHTIAVSGGSTGTLTIEAAYPGSSVYFPVPRGVIALDDPRPFRFVGPVGSFRFTVSGASGGGNLSVTDSGGEVALQGYAYDYGEMAPYGAWEGLRALTVQYFPEANIKRGVQYYARVAYPNDDPLGGQTSRKLHFITGSKPVLVKLRVFEYVGEELRISLYSSPVVTSPGTEIPISNWNLVNPVPTTVQAYKDVATSDDGTPFAAPEYFFGGPTALFRDAHSIPEGRERVIPANSEFLVVIENMNGADARCQYFLDWYEGDTDIPVVG